MTAVAVLRLSAYSIAAIAGVICTATCTDSLVPAVADSAGNERPVVVARLACQQRTSSLLCGEHNG